MCKKTLRELIDEPGVLEASLLRMVKEDPEGFRAMWNRSDILFPRKDDIVCNTQKGDHE